MSEHVIDVDRIRADPVDAGAQILVLRDRVSKLEAEVVVLREALVNAVEWVEEGIHFEEAMGWHKAAVKDAEACARWRLALSSTAASDFEARVRANEREACSKLVEQLGDESPRDILLAPACRHIAQAIRARGTK